MPDKDWVVPCGEFALLVRRRTERGRVCEFAVVLMAFFDDDWRGVTRYDSAHEQPHRDVFGRKAGLRVKLFLANMNNNQAFDYAIRDLTKNAQAYLADFLAH